MMSDAGCPDHRLCFAWLGIFCSFPSLFLLSLLGLPSALLYAIRLIHHLSKMCRNVAGMPFSRVKSGFQLS